MILLKWWEWVTTISFNVEAKCGFFTSDVLWCSKWYPWYPCSKKLCFGSRLGGRHMGQVRTAGSIHKKILKSGVWESPTLTKLQLEKKKQTCLGFTLKDLGCSFCTHVFGKWLLGVVYDKLWISNNFPKPSTFSFSWSFSYFLIFMFTIEKIKPEGRMPFLRE